MSSLLELSNNLAEIVARVGGAVVGIKTDRRFAPSGIHWRNGIIVTSDESLQNYDGISVVVAEGRILPITLLGRDPSTDVAVFQIEATDLPVATIGTSDTLKVGQIVLAVARSLEGDVRSTMGTASVITGSWQSSIGGTIDRYIRPDLTFNPGYVGGALVDAAGNVVGMNTSGRRGAALTIPAETVDRVVEQLTTKGRIVRGYLGVGMQPVRLPQYLVAMLNLANSQGVTLVNVEPNSPADRAGMLWGDVLVTLDGIGVGDPGDVRGILNRDRIGRTIPAQLVRGGGLVDVSVTVGERTV
jgi:S1-C subfamily serine protease